MQDEDLSILFWPQSINIERLKQHLAGSLVVCLVLDEYFAGYYKVKLFSQ